MNGILIHFFIQKIFKLEPNMWVLYITAMVFILQIESERK